MSLTGYSKSEVVLLPLPLDDAHGGRVRPAVVIGRGSHADELFVVPISSQLAKADLPLQDWRAAGLEIACGIRSQIATIESKRIIKALGILSARDQSALERKLRAWLEL